MKLLHIGIMQGGGFSEALKATFEEVVEVPVNPASITNCKDDFDACFIQVQSEKIGDYSSVELLRPIAKRGFTINWTGDIRKTTPEWMIQLPCDIVAFSNERDVMNVRSRLRRSEFLQIGVDPKIFNYHGHADPRAEIVFMGNDYGGMFPLGAVRRHIMAALRSKYGSRLGLFGTFPQADDNLTAREPNPDEWQHREAAVYRGAKVAISISHFQENRYTSDRLLRSMACGCLVMAMWYPGIEKDFTDGEHLIVFRDLQELIAKLEYYLARPEEATRIGMQGAKLISEKFTFKSMAENIKQLIP